MAKAPATEPTTPAANGEDTLPQVGMISQYIKDLSFENPNSPHIYQWQGTPQIDIQYGISSSTVGEEVYEVVLKIDVKAMAEDKVAFQVDLSYGGLFGLRNVPEEQAQPFLLGEAPRLMFPFARRVVSDVVLDGGYAPLLLEPIDFGGLYLQQMEEAAKTAAAQPEGHA